MPVSSRIRMSSCSELIRVSSISEVSSSFFICLNDFDMNIRFSSSTEPALPTKDVNVSSYLSMESFNCILNSYILSSTDCVRMRHIYEGVSESSILPVSQSGIRTAYVSRNMFEKFLFSTTMSRDVSTSPRRKETTSCSSPTSSTFVIISYMQVRNADSLVSFYLSL